MRSARFIAAATIGVMAFVLSLSVTAVAAPSVQPRTAIELTALTPPPYPGVLEQGSAGRAVAWVQKALIRRGYSIPSLESGRVAFGYYDVFTAAAVYRFKRNHPNLATLNGMVGPRTYALLVGSATDPGTDGGTSSPSYTSISQCSSLPDTTSRSLSKAQRATVSLSSFVRSRMGCKVVVRESTGSCTVVNPAGYYGKWQLDMQEWRYYGGIRYSDMPHHASCATQDLIALRNWRDRGWSPWTTAY